MGASTDKVSGRLKQAIGALTGNKDLKRAGARDERVGRIKEKTDETIDAVLDKLEDDGGIVSSNEKEK
jgi:uncharacterized protein YjbJ (UPF0337 family)